MTRIARSDGIKITTRWETRRNHFGGCLAMACPFVETCSARHQHQACPFGDEAFEAANPRDRAQVGENTIHYSLVDKIADDLAGVPNPMALEVTHVAVSTHTADTDPAATIFSGEIYRDTFVDRQRPSIGKLVLYWFLGTTVANGALRSWSFFAGGASNVPGSGTPINRFLSPIDKTSADTVSGQYSITFAGV